MVPEFYSNLWTNYYYFNKEDNIDAVLGYAERAAIATANDLMPSALPNYVLFYDDVDLEKRIAKMTAYYPTLTYRTTIESGWFDILLHRLNPKNSLEKIHIYSTDSVYAPILPPVN
jgi:hypothetical protein